MDMGVLMAIYAKFKHKLTSYLVQIHRFIFIITKLNINIILFYQRYFVTDKLYHIIMILKRYLNRSPTFRYEFSKI